MPRTAATFNGEALAAMQGIGGMPGKLINRATTQDTKRPPGMG